MAGEHALTQLLQAHRQGDRSATDKLFSMVYHELREVAHRQLRYRRPSQTINTTALVHEVYLKTLSNLQGTWQDKAHFLAVMAQAMRQVLVDYVRKMQAQKRGGKARHVALDEAALLGENLSLDVLDIDRGLQRLAEVNPRYSRIVELRFFGGLTVDEMAEVLGISNRTVERDWIKAKAFLYLMLGEEKEQ